MDRSSVSRRDFVAASTGVAASAWLVNHVGVGEALAYAAQAASGARYAALTPAEVRELDAVTSTLVPSDGTPGAKEAHVVRFIDRSLATWAKDQKKGLEDALAALAKYTGEQRPGTTSFATLPAADRVKVMEGFEKDHGAEFGALFMPTVAGMFTNPSYGGNANKVGWALMGFTDQFSWKPPFGYYDRA
jgi:gluconate 2-dehydrogenase gamma chain